MRSRYNFIFGSVAYNSTVLTKKKSLHPHPLRKNTMKGQTVFLHIEKYFQGFFVLNQNIQLKLREMWIELREISRTILPGWLIWGLEAGIKYSYKTTEETIPEWNYCLHHKETNKSSDKGKQNLIFQACSRGDKDYNFTSWNRK